MFDLRKKVMVGPTIWQAFFARPVYGETGRPEPGTAAKRW